MNTMEAWNGTQPSNLWFYVLKLLRLQWVILANSFKRASPLHKILTLLLGLLSLGILVGGFVVTQSFLGLLDSPLLVELGVNPAPVMEAIPPIIVTWAFLGILMTSFGVMLQALYLASDMDFLLTAPIPIRAVFLSKLLQAIFPAFILAGLLGLPVLFGLGIANGYSILYFLLAIVILVFLSLAAAGFASLFVMAIVRYIPAKRVGEMLVFLGGILFAILITLFNLAGKQIGEFTPEQVYKSSQSLTLLNSNWSPLTWAGRSLVDLAEGRQLSGILFLTLSLGLAGCVFWFALKTSERLYYTGWASMQVETTRKKASRPSSLSTRNRVRASIFQHIVPPAVRAIMLKDIRVMRRALRNLSQLISSLIACIGLSGMLLLNSGNLLAGKGEAPGLAIDVFKSALAYGSLGISLIVGWSLASRQALISFSMEGRSYYIIRTSPVSAGKQMAAKFLLAYIPPLLLCWLFMLVIAWMRKVPSATLLYGFPSTSLILAGLVGISLAFGVRGANLDWSDPRQMTSKVTDYLQIILGIAYLIPAALLFFAPPVGLPLLLGISEVARKLVGLLAGGTIALLCTFLPLMFVKERVYRIGEG